MKAREHRREKRTHDRERRKIQEAAEKKRAQIREFNKQQNIKNGTFTTVGTRSRSSSSATSEDVLTDAFGVPIPEPISLTPKQRNELTGHRVIQRNLVYVIGLAPKIAREELLRSHEYFGQYGEIIKAVVNRSHIKQNTHNSASAYITYKKQDAAREAIAAIHGFVWDDRTIKASFGTTKYCNMFLKGLKCTNGDCLYLHYLGDDNDSFTKEQMQQSSKQQFIDQTRLADDIDTKISLDKRPTIFPKPQSVLDRIEQAKADAKHQATTAATPAARGGGTRLRAA